MARPAPELLSLSRRSMPAMKKSATTANSATAPSSWPWASPRGPARLLGVSVALSEAEVHWRAFFQSLVQRGLCGVSFIVSDDHPGWPPPARPSLAPSPGNAANSTSSKTPKLTSPAWISAPKWPAPSAASLNPHPSRGRTTAQGNRPHYTKSAPKLARWMEENLPQGFTVFRCRSPIKNACAPPTRWNASTGTQTPHPRRPSLPQ